MQVPTAITHPPMDLGRQLHQLPVLLPLLLTTLLQVAERLLAQVYHVQEHQPAEQFREGVFADGFNVEQRDDWHRLAVQQLNGCPNSKPRLLCRFRFNLSCFG